MKNLNLLQSLNRNHIVEIHLGMPSKECLFHGICWMEHLSDVQILRYQARPNYCTATLAWQNREQITIEFSKSSMTEETMQQHFSDGYFYLLEPIILSKIDRQAYPKPPKLLAGVYPVTVTKEAFVVDFFVQTDYESPAFLAEMIRQSSQRCNCRFC